MIYEKSSRRNELFKVTLIKFPEKKNISDMNKFKLIIVTADKVRIFVIFFGSQQKQ